MYWWIDCELDANPLCSGHDFSTAPEEVIRQAYEMIHPPEPVEEAPTEMVHHPSHYNREGAMECIDEMVTLFGKEVVKHFCLCNIHKYRYRAAAKNGEEDIKKSDFYVKSKVKFLEFLRAEKSCKPRYTAFAPLSTDAIKLFKLPAGDKISTIIKSVIPPRA